MIATTATTGTRFDHLVRAVELSRSGADVEFVEPRLRAGGALVTESFLTPFRFNLGPSLVRRPPIPELRVREPDPLLAVGETTLSRSPVELAAGETVADALEASGIAEPSQRALLTAFAVLLGIDPKSAGSGAALAAACASSDDLVVIEGGNGVAVAHLVDEIVRRGGRVLEGVGAVDDGRATVTAGIGICRLFVGLRRSAPAASAFATAVGVDEASLDALRAGEVGEPAGFVIDNTHLDPRRPGDALGSFIWQGLLPAEAELSQADYTSAVLAALGIDDADVVFRLLWLPRDTGESLR